MRVVIPIIVAVLLFSSSALAQGGFQGPGPGLDTVERALSYRDDTPVILQGHILSRLGGDRYLFEDESGSITVDIDDHLWRGQTVTPQDRVEIQGEVDKDWNNVEVDVDSVKLL
jgi:uncharacterized protein (TIGR00156 family)